MVITVIYVDIVDRLFDLPRGKWPALSVSGLVVGVSETWMYMDMNKFPKTQDS